MFKRFQLLYYSIINTRVLQLYHRLRLLIKRKILFFIATDSFASKKALSPKLNISLSKDKPFPIFEPRRKLIRKLNNNKLEVGFLNVWRPLQLPMQWHPSEMKKGTRLWLLNLHYMEYLEAIDNSNWFEYVKDWILSKSNKPYKKGYWLDNWNSYALSIRVVVWMQEFCRRGHLISESDKDLFLKSILAQVRFLKSNLELDIGGNHLVKNIKALLWASKFFDGPEAEYWSKLASKLLLKELKEQVLLDGAHFELSPSYHAQVFADLLECYVVAEDELVKNELKSKLPKMAQFLHDMIHPDGNISLFNDGGFDMSYTPQECLLLYKKLLGFETKQSSIVTYSNAGYFGLRNEDNLFIMDAAELGPKYLPGHGHGDALSFEWSLMGQRVFVDPGVYEYNPGQLRSFSRSTKNHNTVTLDNKDQSEFWKAFRVGRRASIIDCKVKSDKDSLNVLASHDGYFRLKGKPIHKRQIDVTRYKIQIKDTILNGHMQSATSRFMLAPDISIEKLEEKLYLFGKKFKIAVSCEHPLEIEDSYCFLNFGHKINTKQLVINFGYSPCATQISFEAEIL